MGRLTALAAAALVAVAACDPRGRRTKPNSLAAKVAEYVPRVEAQTGFRFRTPPKVEARSRADVRAFLEREMLDARAARQLDGEQAAYRRFGLVPDTFDLKRTMVSLLTEQVVGFYDPRTKTLYVVDSAPPEIQGLTIAHELVHALQDQYVNLDSLQHADVDDDRLAAAQAAIEGQAMYESTVMIIGNEKIASIPGGWERIREQIRQSRDASPALAAAPTALQEGLLFPYLSGAEYARRAKERAKPGEWALSRIPESTEQVLHAPAFFSATPDRPTTVSLGTIPGATFQNAMGEFGTRLFLFQHVGSDVEAARGAQGWDGDRYAIVATPSGDALVWATVWDTPVDAAEFRDLLERATARRYDAQGTKSGDALRFAAAGRAVEIGAGAVGGRPVVTYLDRPAAASVPPLAIERITLSEP